LLRLVFLMGGELMFERAMTLALGADGEEPQDIGLDKCPSSLQSLVRMVERTMDDDWENRMAIICEDGTQVFKSLDDLDTETLRMLATFPHVVGIGFMARSVVAPADRNAETPRADTAAGMMAYMKAVESGKATAVAMVCVETRDGEYIALHLMDPRDDTLVANSHWRTFFTDNNALKCVRGTRGDFQDLFWRAANDAT
jgi:hypothetical protein